ncbi:MAG: hypothetical protein HYU46_16025 [Deltaproteobacteria bacterium]|nr:hypothetical protein [Deltaproteobacteria bacterium]
MARRCWWLLLAAAACGRPQVPPPLSAPERLPGNPSDDALAAIGDWDFAPPQDVDFNPSLGGYPSSRSRAMAAVAEGATVGGVNEALERAGARIAGSIPVGGILDDFARRASV